MSRHLLKGRVNERVLLCAFFCARSTRFSDDGLYENELKGSPIRRRSVRERTQRRSDSPTVCTRTNSKAVRFADGLYESELKGGPIRRRSVRERTQRRSDSLTVCTRANSKAVRFADGPYESELKGGPIRRRSVRESELKGGPIRRWSVRERTQRRSDSPTV